MTKKQRVKSKQEKERHEERERARESEGANRENKGDEITVAQPLCLLFYSRASLITTSVLSAPSQQSPG